MSLNTRDSRSDDCEHLRIKDRVWIFNDAEKLTIKMLFIAHAGQAGHRGSQATSLSLSETHTWISMTWDSKNFEASYLLCVSYLSASKLPQILATAPHATKRGEVIY